LKTEIGCLGLALALAISSASVVRADSSGSARAAHDSEAALRADARVAHLDAPVRQDLLRTLRQLTEAHDQLAGMSSDCSGGRILVFGCVQRPGSECREAVAPCSLVEAFQAINLAIVRIDGVLQ